MNILEIREKALLLPKEQRLDLLNSLQESLEDDNIEPPDWHGDILAERLRKIESGEATLISSEEFFERMDARTREARLSQ